LEIGSLKVGMGLAIVIKIQCLSKEFFSKNYNKWEFSRLGLG